MPDWQTLKQRSRPSDLLCLERLPRLRSGYVLRDKFTLPGEDLPNTIGIFAPSGFGKTQLLAFWYYDLRSRGFEPHWINEASPETIVANAAELLPVQRTKTVRRAIFIDNADRPEILPRLSGILNDRQDADIVVVAARQPCASTADFDLVFSQEDLRFSSEEATALLRNRCASVDPEIAADIVHHCAGIPAVLNIAIADLANDPTTRQATFRNDASFFAAYAQDCLAHLTDEENSLLRDIAVPETFSLDLAAHLTGRADCQGAIVKLMHELPFFLRVGKQHHALLPAFRDALLDGETDTPRALSLHQEAARWFADRHMHGEALDHAIAARDIEFAVDLMGSHLLEIAMAGELERVLGWLAAVPRDRLTRNPDLCLAAALAYLVAGQSEPTDWFMTQLSSSHQAIVLACHHSLKERYDQIEQLLRQIRSVDELSPVAAACYGNLCRSMRQRRGEWQSTAEDPFVPPLPAEPFRSIRAIGMLLETERLLMMGKGGQAIALVEPLLHDCEALLGRSSSVTDLLAVSLASACFQTGDFNRARQILVPRLDSMCQHNIPPVPCNALLTAARLEAVRGDFAACLDLLERLETLGIERDIPRLRALAQAERVRIYALTKQQMLASVTLAALQKTQKSVRASSPFHSSRVDLEVLLARAHFLRSLGKTKNIAPILDAAEMLARKLGRTMERAEAVILRQAGRSAKTFDGRLDWLGIDAADLQTLLSRMHDEQQDDTSDAMHPQAHQTAQFNILGRPVLVQMTDREIHILEGLGRDLSNKAIARELQLSSETVKWYVAKILTKLGAHDRRQAVDRARAFGLLPMFHAKPWLQNAGVEARARLSIAYGRS